MYVSKGHLNDGHFPFYGTDINILIIFLKSCSYIEIFRKATLPKILILKMLWWELELT